ncbi:MAG TPA: GH92 family glycosyl hydrolase [Acidisarcina sp.]
MRKLSRRRFLKGASAAGVVLSSQSGGLHGLTLPARDDHDARSTLTGHVDVFLGTGGHGHTFPGATVPFGMVQLSPDTGTLGWDHCSGYHRDDRYILGFSHTHLSGTGVGDMLDFLLAPSTGPVYLDPGQEGQPGYRSRFSHDEEHGEPGYYRVTLRGDDDRPPIEAEMTATSRVGVHRYSFPAGAGNHFILDLAHGIIDTSDPPSVQPLQSRVLSAELHVEGKDTITGGRRYDAWASGRYIYFAMQFSKPFAAATVYEDGKHLPEAIREANGKSLKCALSFPMEKPDTIIVKVGLSAVSIEGAIKNLHAEVPAWDFDAARRAASHAWQHELARVQIETTNEAHKRTFYSGLYHAMVAPTLFSDVDGRYRGSDFQIHQLPTGASNYTTFSLWDTYRALHPLYTLMLHERLPDLLNSLIRMAEEGPAGVPVWPLQGFETGCMIGYHSAVVLAEAHAKGIAGVDYKHAYTLWRKRAMDDPYRGLPEYRSLGYLPCDTQEESVSKTLEYAYDDWAMAQLALAAGAGEDRQLLLKRSRNYKNVFDRSVSFVRGRLQDGKFADPFDPRAMGHSKRWRDFTESNSWEATFLNQHDVHEYMSLFDDDKTFLAKLDLLFHQSSDLPADAPPDITGMVGQYSQGNEPDHHVVYLYSYAGAPSKTQAQIRSLLETMYSDAPDGLSGNEDCGQMSAWYIMSALGLYAVDPVSGNYVFGSPLFDRATLDVGGGKRLVIRAINNGPDRPYIHHVTWNGRPHSKSWISHTELIQGGTLTFTMSAVANAGFGQALADRPPSFV